MNITDYLPVDGQSLLGLIDGRDASDRTAFSEMHSSGVYTTCFMARQGSYKYIYIHGEDDQLFNLDEDPGEWHSLIGQPAVTGIEDELRQRKFARSQIVLDRLFKTGEGLGELHFFQGELYRKRGQEGDRDKAIESYQAALHYEDAPPKTHRLLGMLLAKSGEEELARDSYRQYLNRHPQADDRDMIQSIIQRLH